MTDLTALGVPVIPWRPADGPPADDGDDYVITGDDGEGPLYCVSGTRSGADDLAARTAALTGGRAGPAAGGESNRRLVWVAAVEVPS